MLMKKERPNQGYHSSYHPCPYREAYRDGAWDKFGDYLDERWAFAVGQPTVRLGDAAADGVGYLQARNCEVVPNQDDQRSQGWQVRGDWKNGRGKEGA